MNETTIPPGLCQCGCGQPTRRAPYSSARIGWVRGEWTRYVLGHNHRPTPRYEVDPATGCWNTLGAKTTVGYGKIGVDRSTVYLHRYMYEQAFGPIPAGKHLHHTCRNKGCCNPAHLAVMGRTEHRRADKQFKLTDADVALIRALGTFDVPATKIAERFGVHPRYVHALLRGHARKEG